MGLVDKPEQIELKGNPKSYPDYTLADVTALRDVARGEASSEQQKRAIEYIVNVVAGTYDIPLRGTEQSTIATIGKAIVGKHIVWLLKVASTEGSEE